ncbi:MAG: arginine deiminase-related protein [Paludibacter sp.]|nr:arginine deiminase-related protein [Paludibacter sp.]
MDRQITNTVLMVEPVAFGFNKETAVNNYFMQENQLLGESEMQELAHSEFQQMVEILQKSGVRVIVSKDTMSPHKPDSIFPNNWISFHYGRRIALYPMFAENRRSERRKEVVNEVNKTGYAFTEVVDYSIYENEQRFLEGTGSMILDRVNRIAYAALSERTNETLFKWFCNDFGFRPVIFHAMQSVNGKRMPVYHTNVALSIGEDFAVVCSDCIDAPEEKELLLQTIEESGKKVIKITEKQMQSFAGNVLQLENVKGEKLLIMSATAYSSLEKIQLEMFRKINRLVVVPVPTIERYGGGSVRCMMAEVFGERIN